MRALGRRQFLATSLHAASGMAFSRAPAILRQSNGRPAMTYGTTVGDVTGDRAIVWSRSDRPARMHVEWATTESFRNARRVADAAVASEATGLTARVDLSGLPRGQRIHYRVVFEDLADARSLSEPASGSFQTAPAAARDLTFAWSADTVGQGWGINLEWGGMRMYETIRLEHPDFFIHCGDTIYADAPLPTELTLSDGTIWKNVVTPAKSKVAETLDEFRGNHLYNLLDDNVRRFNADIPQIVLWDDHDVKNNWYPTMSLASDDRYTVKDPAVLVRNARRAFIEHVPIRVRGDSPIFRSVPYGPLLEVFALDLRSYRGPNTEALQRVAGPDTALAGAAQIRWLKQALSKSTATWKVIASDQPISVPVVDSGVGFDAFANVDGAPLGREIELADVLSYIEQARIRNVVWVTGDVHYAAAFHYAPERARVRNFRPFWEFIAGPLHAGTGTPRTPDDTFGPEERFMGVPREANAVGPAAGLQFFGKVAISAASRTMRVSLHNLKGDTVFATDIEPES
jgi:alkaline phosphatase D